MRNLLSTIMTGAFLVGSPLATTTATAAEPHVVVNYSDLDLNSSDAVEVLYGRIKKAAQRLCTDDGRRRMDERVKEQLCVARTISETVGKIQNDRLAGLYKQRATHAG